MKQVRYRFLGLLIFVFFILLFMVGLFADTYTKTFLQREFMKQTEMDVQAFAQRLYESMERGASEKEAFLAQEAQSDAAVLALYDAEGQLLYTNDEAGDFQTELTADDIKQHSGDWISAADNRFYYVQALEKTDGYLLYGTEWAAYKEVKLQLWGMIGILFLVCVLFCLTFVNRILKCYLNPMDEVMSALGAAIKGDYSKKIFVHEHNETRRMTMAADEILKYLREISKEYSTNEVWMKTLIENMSAGLILIDEKGYIQVLNRYLERLIHVNRRYCIGEIYHQVIGHKDITNMIEEVFMKEEKIERELVIREGIKEQYLLIHGAPIVSSRSKWRGVFIVFHDVTRLKRLEKMRKDFVANVSHELRTPITSIKGFTETLLEGAYKDEKTAYEFLHIMQKESARMENLIRDLLELSQIENQGFHLRLHPINLTDIVRNVLKTLKPSIEEKGISVGFDTFGEAYIWGDESNATQIIINILSNARNYTSENGSIDIEIRENVSKHEVELEVRDTGIGIPEKDLPRIFERFYRADRARSRDSGGTGLGLSIVKHSMQAHRGSVAVQSQVGEGTAFILRFQMYEAEREEGLA